MRPVLLLVAGMFNDDEVWQDVARAVAPLADLRMALPRQDSIAAMAQAAWARLDDVPAGVPVVLAGFSLGGYVVQEMLAAPRRALAAAALISTSARPETPEGSAVREKTMAALARDVVKVVDGLVGFGTHEAPPALAQRMRAMMLRVGADTAIRQTRAIMGRADHRAVLGRLQLPVAVLCGQQDRITPPALSQELAALVPGAQLHLIDGSGHMLPLEQPRAVAGVLAALLQQARTQQGDSHGQA